MHNLLQDTCLFVQFGDLEFTLLLASLQALQSLTQVMILLPTVCQSLSCLIQPLLCTHRTDRHTHRERQVWTGISPYMHNQTPTFSFNDEAVLFLTTNALSFNPCSPLSVSFPLLDLFFTGKSWHVSNKLKKIYTEGAVFLFVQHL